MQATSRAHALHARQATALQSAPKLPTCRPSMHFAQNVVAFDSSSHQCRSSVSARNPHRGVIARSTNESVTQFDVDAGVPPADDGVDLGPRDDDVRRTRFHLFSRGKPAPTPPASTSPHSLQSLHLTLDNLQVLPNSLADSIDEAAKVGSRGRSPQSTYSEGR